MPTFARSANQQQPTSRGGFCHNGNPHRIPKPPITNRPALLTPLARSPIGIMRSFLPVPCHDARPLHKKLANDTGEHSFRMVRRGTGQ